MTKSHVDMKIEPRQACFFKHWVYHFAPMFHFPRLPLLSINLLLIRYVYHQLCMFTILCINPAIDVLKDGKKFIEITYDTNSIHLCDCLI